MTSPKNWPFILTYSVPDSLIGFYCYDHVHITLNMVSELFQSSH